MLPLSHDLLQWLCGSPSHWRTVPLGTRARLRWTSHWNTLNMRLSRARLPAAQQAEPAPWLILGCWRSGTTVMHELLAAATGLPTPRTWQCMSACSFALLGVPPQDSTVARPMDGLQIGPLSPQEDEFALLSLGVDSAYRGFLMPGRLPELRHTLQASHWLHERDWLARLETFLSLCRMSSGAPTGAMLLKSPNHSFRLQALRARWPEARVIWMLRDPAEIFLSNRKMWRQMMDMHRLPGVPPLAPEALDAFLAEALVQCARQLRWLSGQDDPHWHVCRQEALKAAPGPTIARVLAAIAPGCTPDTARLSQAVTLTSSGRIECYETSPPAAARQAIEDLRAAQDEALSRQAARH